MSRSLASPCPNPSGHPSSLISPSDSRHRNNRLTLSQHLFINAYLDAMKANGGDVEGCARKAYLFLHPRVKPESADSLASKLLTLVKVQTEIARRVRYQDGITLDLVTSDLLTAHTLALQSGNPALIASVAMDCAKLAGFLVEKRQDVSQQLPALSEDQIWAELSRRMKQRDSSTTRMSPPTEMVSDVPHPLDANPSVSTGEQNV